MGSKTSIVLGTRKGLLTLTRTDSGWETEDTGFLGVPISYAVTDPRSGMLWACLDTDHWGSKLQRSNDSGKTWEEISLPKYPPDAEIHQGIPATLSYIWTLQPGPDDQPERLYLGTEPGGLFQSDDGGTSFRLVDGLWDHPSRMTQWFGGGRDYPGVHSIITDPRDSARILVGISVGGVFETLDGGANWAPRNRGLQADYLPNPEAEVGHDPHCLVMSPANPNILMQQNHCGIFRSEDSGITWESVSEKNGPAHFGFALAMDEVNPNTAWVVPAISDEMRVPVKGALCVSRTEDAGKTWQSFREGLPQEDCYDYAYRHALDVKGDQLVFGTTSGNVFFSQDRGECWDCLGTNFPLIYSVRFDRTK